MSHMFSNLKVNRTRHFEKQRMLKGIPNPKIERVLNFPGTVYPSGSKHPDQFRMTGDGICLVVKPDAERLNLITVYVNTEETPLRPDQKRK